MRLNMEPPVMSLGLGNSSTVDENQGIGEKQPE